MTERQKEAAKMRAQGATYDAIAQRFGVSKSRAYQMAFDGARDKRRIFDGAEVSVRVYNCLRMEGCTTWDDVSKIPASTLLRAPNFGSKSMKEVNENLLARGFTPDNVYPSASTYWEESVADTLRKRGWSVSKPCPWRGEDDGGEA